jgi:hypothetical protein
MKFDESTDPEKPKVKRFMSTALEAGEFTIIAEVHEYRMDFTAYECTAICREQGSEIYKVCYDEIDAPGSPCFTEDIEKAERYACGWIKWDGCINWRYRPDNGVDYLHLCGRSGAKKEAEKLGHLFDRLYDAVNELLPSYDGDD